MCYPERGSTFCQHAIHAKDTTTTGGTITPVPQTKILSWSWFDPEENLLDGRLELTGITEEVQPSFTEIIEYLPTAIIARVEGGKDGEKVEDEEEKNLSITNWSCPEYVQDEEGRWPLEGTYELKQSCRRGMSWQRAWTRWWWKCLWWEIRRR